MLMARGKDANVFVYFYRCTFICSEMTSFRVLVDVDWRFPRTDISVFALSVSCGVCKMHANLNLSLS